MLTTVVNLSEGCGGHLLCNFPKSVEDNADWDGKLKQIKTSFILAREAAKVLFTEV